MGASQSQTRKIQRYLETEILSSIYPPPSIDIIKIPSRRSTKATLHNAQQININAKLIEGQIEGRISINDGRTRVSNTSAWPYSAHGFVAVRFKGNDGISWGTGTLIGPNVVLTAAHNLYNYDRKVYAELESLQFLPGMQGKIPPFGITLVKQFFVSPNYVNQKKDDFAILLLKEPIGERTGYFGLACLKPEEIIDRKINVTGYPFDKVEHWKYEMWTMGSINAFVDDAEEFINYPIDTATGQSGAGVWYEEEGEYYVCGIHVQGGAFFNQGAFMTKNIYEQIYKWLKQASLQQYLLRVGDITKLDFRDFRVDAECISLLLKYDLEGLDTLDLSKQFLGREGAKTLTKNASWRSLSCLLLSKNNIGDEGAIAIAKNNSWDNLSVLHLGSNSIGVDGVSALAKNESLKNLTILNLSLNKIGAEGAEALAKNASWTKLSRLFLGSNNIGTEGTVALAKNISWVDLEHLDLHSNYIGPEAGAALAINLTWKKLASLNLGWNKINGGIRELAKNKSWKNLSYLNLSCNHVGLRGSQALAKNKSWSNLTTLHLFCCDIGEEQVEILRKNSRWKCLTRYGINIDEFPHLYDEFAGKLDSGTISPFSRFSIYSK